MTEVSNDFNCDYLFENNDQEKNESNKTINILSIGNSYSQDALSYVPFIMKNIAPDINMNIGIIISYKLYGII